MADYSLNETATRAKLAAKGVGYSWGMAEEVARSVFWLVSRDLPGPALLVELLSNYSTAESVRLAMPSVKDGCFTTEHTWLCPIATGCALSDTYRVVDDATQINLSVVKCPILLLPFVAEVAQRSGIVLALEMDNKVIATDGEHVRNSGINSEFLEQATSVVCRRAEAEEFESDVAHLKKMGQQRAVIDDPVWKALGAYAYRTYAPSTQSSRELGAGAGLNDND